MTSAFDKDVIKQEFVAGGTAGAIGILIGFPLDLVKVQIQTFPEKYPSAWAAFRHTVSENGVMGLYRGCLPPVMMQ
ncbi:mitochondrial substrate/solute carrier, partial [Ochromonadaceae sp. CCMP2298]